MSDVHPTFAELRRARRLRLPLETLRRAEGRTLRDRLIDLSGGGFSLWSPSPLVPGDVLELRLVSADRSFDIPVKGEVVHVRSSRQPGLKRVGCKFIGEPPVRKLLLTSLHVLAKSNLPPRLEVGADAVWSGPGGASTGALYLANLGLEGALVHGTGLPPVGGHLILGIYPPDSQEMVALPAKVLWSLEAGEDTVAGLGFSLEDFTRAAVASYLETLLFTPFDPPPQQPECPPQTRVGGFVVEALIEKCRSHDFYRARAIDPESDSEGSAQVTLRRFTGSPRDVDHWSDRFLDAMQIGARLAGEPRSLRVFGATRERDAAWLVTELFPSTTFDRLLAQQDRGNPAGLPVEGLITVIAEALRGLAACHAHAQLLGEEAIVHGDLRPSVIHVGDDGQVKLSGFGVAPTTVVPGGIRVPPDSAAYQPPEHYRNGGPLLPTADVFQMGVVLYEALTGAAPFDAQNPSELERQANAGPRPPSHLNPRVSLALQNVVLRALAADPGQRHANAGELLTALEAAQPASEAEPRPAAVPLPDLLQRVVTRSGEHPAYDPRPTPAGDLRPVRRRLLEAGETLGRYEVVENIARGGAAEVYRARIAGSDGREQMVLKTVYQDDETGMGHVKRFLQEARVAALLDHPNVVKLFDYGFDRGRTFIAMDYVHGVALGELLELLSSKTLRLPYPLAARIASEACAGLGHAHALRDAEGHTVELVHRDVTARNILIGFGGQVKLLDFGIARFRGSSEVTSSGRVRGTSAYLAPEQIREQPVTRAIDIWALGVNLYRLITGLLPFERETLAQSITAVLEHEPPPAHTLSADIPLELSQIAQKAMSKDPAERYSRTGQMQNELERYLIGKPGHTADLKAFMELLYPSRATGPRRAATGDLTAAVARLQAQPQPLMQRAVALMEPLGAWPAVSRAPTPPAPPARASPRAMPPNATPLAAIKLVSMPASQVQKAAAPVAPSPPPPSPPPAPAVDLAPPSPPAEPATVAGISELSADEPVEGVLLPDEPEPALAPAPAEDLDIAVTEEPLAESWTEVTREVPALVRPLHGGTAAPGAAGWGDTTAVVMLDQEALRKRLGARKGPLGLVTKPLTSPPRWPAPAPASTGEDRFGPNPAAADPMGDFFLDEPSRGEPQAPTTAPVPSPFAGNAAGGAAEIGSAEHAPAPFSGLTTEPMPALAQPQQFSTASTEQVPAYKPQPAADTGPVPEPSPMLVTSPDSVPDAVVAPNDALEWMRLWCTQPDTYLVIPGEAPVPRIWVARLMLDGYLAGKPSDASWASFDAWARAQLGPLTGKWLGDSLLAADPERDHRNAIDALLALIEAYDARPR